MTGLPTNELGQVVARSKVVVCCGSGGVGKTTTAALIAMEAARSGRRAVVVTIDPARRLADALGLEGLTNEPSRIDGGWPGELWALMLDTKSTFDGLVRRYSATEAQSEAGPSDWFTEKKVEDPTVDHRCCSSKDHRGNDEHYRRGPSL